MRASLLLALVISSASVFAQTIEIDGVPYRVVQPDQVDKAAVLPIRTSILESKFDSFTPPSRAKLAGLNAVLLLDDPAALKAAKALKRGDNVSCHGTLKATADGKGLELQVMGVGKLPSDLERYAAKVAQLRQNLANPQMIREDRLVSAESAIELGRRIDAEAQQTIDFNARIKLEQLCDDAYKLGLNNKELALEARRCGRLFLSLERNGMSCAAIWPNTANCWKACLKIDPDHPRASKVATDYVQNGEDRSRVAHRGRSGGVPAQAADDARKLIDAQQAKTVREQQELKDAMEQRPEKLRKMQLALSTSDPRKLEGALESACAEIKSSVDPEFGVQAVEILAGIENPVALACGLDAASHHPLTQVRREAYEALAWRSRIAADQEVALRVITGALKLEKDAGAARTGVEALLATKEKPAIGSLVASLSTSEAPVRQEIIAGLKSATGQEFATADEWVKWWTANGK